jgi:hypothetical protein
MQHTTTGTVYSHWCSTQPQALSTATVKPLMQHTTTGTVYSHCEATHVVHNHRHCLQPQPFIFTWYLNNGLLGGFYVFYSYRGMRTAMSSEWLNLVQADGKASGRKDCFSYKKGFQGIWPNKATRGMRVGFSLGEMQKRWLSYLITSTIVFVITNVNSTDSSHIL